MRNGLALLVAGGMAAALQTPAAAWDYPGHRIVGAIADLVMAAHYPAAYRKVTDLIAVKDAGGNTVKRTLSQVAVFPDCAKSGNEPWCGRPSSEEEKAYAQRNPKHDTYHYTDVPIEQSNYLAFSPGTEKTDVVQMIKYAVRQLRAKDAEDRPKMRDVSLTDAEAVWLLAHLVGDIHQPLHVGAAYYDKATCATRTDPNQVAGGMTDVALTNGGNFIRLKPFRPAPAVAPADNLHFFWDGAAVARAMQAAGLAGAESEFARLLAAEAPAGWQGNGDVTSWAEQWANEGIAIAREAHTPLTITLDKRSVSPAGKVSCSWTTEITPEYSDWARDTAREQLRKGGFRLAALLNAIFGP